MTYALFTNPPVIVVFILLFAAVLFPSQWGLSYIRRFLLILALLAVLLLDYAAFAGSPVLTCLCLAAIALFVLVKRHRRFGYLTVKRTIGALFIAALAVIICFWGTPYIAPAFVFIALLAVLAWFMQERGTIIVLTVAGFLFVVNQGYWRDTMETLTILFWSCIICLGLGVPLGIISAHHPRFYRLIQPVLDLMQTLPAFVYLIPALFFFRIGMVPGLLATCVFVLPTPIRLTQAGIASTPKILLEAAQAFGANKHKLLWKVELPHALPEIRASMTQTIMLSLSMVVITATVGGNGLGVKVYRALQTGNVALGFEAGCVIVVVAIVLDRVFRLRKI
ncbi:MAG: ABC transporter permease subunit [Candidatus Tokpelaia sp.]|nr:MAG: ABC transporter permease subunit [Candidatus Tokpelaia sp.]KAA6205063.1 MAG: ABC transporter permease subunit [Candidatus Tokpelaia sp.]KAA6404582.1 choline ABC transporter permease subunit [Candidatus Tokpelaia sp.]